MDSLNLEIEQLLLVDLHCCWLHDCLQSLGDVDVAAPGLKWLLLLCDFYGSCRIQDEEKVVFEERKMGIEERKKEIKVFKRLKDKFCWKIKIPFSNRGLDF